MKKILKKKIRNRWYPMSEVVIDTYTNEYEVKKKTKAYLGLDNTIQFSSKVVDYYNIKNRNYQSICLSIIEKNIDSFIFYKNAYYHLTATNNFPKYKKPNNKIYEIRSYPFIVNEPIVNIPNKLSNILKNTTIGIELETSSSVIPKIEAEKLHFAELYDGSIKGPEYTSKVFTANNLHYVYKMLTLLKCMTTSDEYCSLHIHFGNIPFSDDNLLAIYNLYQRLQDELNFIIAPFRKDYRYLASKDKDHCKNLPKLLNNTSKEIYQLLKLDNLSQEDLRQYKDRNNKWNILGRYYNINFINFICNNSNSKTIEVRPLQMTTNFDYFITFLLVNYYIINYATNHVSVINNKEKKIELSDVISYHKDEISSTVYKNIVIIKDFFYNLFHIKNLDIRNIAKIDLDLAKNIIPYNLFPDTINFDIYNKLVSLDYNVYIKYLAENNLISDHIELIEKSKYFNKSIKYDKTTSFFDYLYKTDESDDIKQKLLSSFIINSIVHYNSHIRNDYYRNEQESLYDLNTNNYDSGSSTSSAYVTFNHFDGDEQKLSAKLDKSSFLKLKMNLDSVYLDMENMFLKNDDVGSIAVLENGIIIKREFSDIFTAILDDTCFYLPITKNMVNRYFTLNPNLSIPEKYKKLITEKHFNKSYTVFNLRDVEEEE
jgi:hypothetical protein